MNELICPNCDKVFKVDKTEYATIQKQVRDHEFKEELKIRLRYAEKEKHNAIQLAENRVRNEFVDELSMKKEQIIELKANFEKSLIENNSKKELQINELKAQIDNSDKDKQLAISEAIEPIRKKCDEFSNNLKNQKIEHELSLKSLEDNYKNIIANERSMKLTLSTKMVGESLEKHCESEFNKIRATGFQNAYFEKDNDASLGSKGDYIFRESDSNGNEIISIMFDMKNESDETTTKKKNEDFLKKLDKDRNQKNCEYAVLVSLLEKDDDFYNQGLVDVSHFYEKMYVVRPQFFVPIISLLRNAALKSMSYKTEIEEMKSTNIDITNFNNKIDDFKTGFVKNYELYDRQNDEAIKELDKAIKNLEKTKEKLKKSNNNLRLANDKLDNISIKKLTHGNPTMKEKFSNLNDNSDQ